MLVIIRVIDHHTVRCWIRTSTICICLIVIFIVFVTIIMSQVIIIIDIMVCNIIIITIIIIIVIIIIMNQVIMEGECCSSCSRHTGRKLNSCGINITHVKLFVCLLRYRKRNVNKNLPTHM